MKRNLEKTLAIACLAAAFMTSTALADEAKTAAPSSEKTAIHQEEPLPPMGHGPALPPPEMMENGKFQMPKLTPAQKEKLDARRKEIFANWSNMSTKERRNAHEQFVNEVRQTQMSNLTPEQKEKFAQEMAQRDKKRAELRDKLAKMTPAQREAFHQKEHEKWIKKRTKNMSSAEKRTFLEQDAAREKRRAEFKAKWDKMTPAEREAWKDEHKNQMGRGYGNGRLPMGPGPVIPQNSAGSSTNASGTSPAK